MERQSQQGQSPEERRASVEKIVAASNGNVPPGVALIDFREATPEERAYAETIRSRAKAALDRAGRQAVA
jgi:hypothetical protein